MWEPLEPSSHLQAELEASKLLVLTHPQKTSKSHVVARVETRWRSYRVKTSRWGQPEVPPARRSWFLFCVTILVTILVTFPSAEGVGEKYDAESRFPWLERPGSKVTRQSFSLFSLLALIRLCISPYITQGYRFPMVSTCIVDGSLRCCHSRRSTMIA